MLNEKELSEIIHYTRKIEGILKNKFEAEGRGLHTYIDSIEVVLDNQLVRNLRYVATIRNNYMHEDKFILHNINSYIKVAKKCIVDLNDISTIKSPKQIEKNIKKVAPSSNNIHIKKTSKTSKTSKTNIKKFAKPIKKVSKDNNIKIKEVAPSSNDISTTTPPKQIDNNIKIKKTMIKWIILILLMVAYIVNNELNYFDFHTKKEIVETKEIVKYRQPSNFSCDGRTYCSQMSSCEEATFYINNCPNTNMDGDGDGIPCRRQWCH